MTDYLEGFGGHDFSLLGDDEVLELVGRQVASPRATAESNRALLEFRGRGYEEYVIRAGRVMGGYVIAPVDFDGLLPSIFMNVEEQAKTFRLSQKTLRKAKIRHIIRKWLDPIVCGTLLANLSETVLLPQIARACEGGKLLEIANKAMGEMRRRYEEEVHKFCLYRVSRTFDAGVADDLVSATFKRVWERAETYDAEGITDPEELWLLTFGWLRAIARNLYYDEVRKCGRTVTFDRVEELDALLWHLRAWTDFKPDQEKARGEAEDGEEAEVPHLDCMRRSMTDVLTARERDILLEEKEMFFTRKERRDALAALEAAHRITYENRRTISSRARRKLEDHMAAHCDECRNLIYLRRVRDLQEKERKKALKAEGQKRPAGKRACRKGRTGGRKPGGNSRASKKRADGPGA